MLKALFFDMDGVIVDTEYLDFQLQSQMIRSIAKEPDSLTHEDFSQLVGRSQQDLLEAIKNLSQTELSFAELEARLAEIAQQKYYQLDYEALFRKDILEIIAYAKKKGLILAVVSSSSREHIEEVLAACGLTDSFDFLISGADFTASKPHPAVYLAALKEAKLEASQALAIEDSYYGILAAKRAGLRVIAYEEERMQIDQSQADYRAKDMLALLELIKDLS
ncbi:HAD family hydrolase [Streptococcus oricebi]|uniref:Haloacid dehalogenase n=1 Tax=Streptococcus oricebi TaxID=1547447 RepID=A0ABS5B6S7_9STRE|nr:HAD family phosphatase [Streptococcus oricebi]MBP2624213.1 haloacid dehalogenase [Streptococcus oricebi]